MGYIYKKLIECDGNLYWEKWSNKIYEDRNELKKLLENEIGSGNTQYQLIDYEIRENGN